MYCITCIAAWYEPLLGILVMTTAGPLSLSAAPRIILPKSVFTPCFVGDGLVRDGTACHSMSQHVIGNAGRSGAHKARNERGKASKSEIYFHTSVHILSVKIMLVSGK